MEPSLKAADLKNPSARAAAGRAEGVRMSTNPLPPTTAMKLRISKQQEATLVVCSGWLTANVKEEFKAEINGLIPETKRVVLDLSNVAFMDSSGLGALVGLYVTARRAGVELQLVNLSQRVRELLGMTNLLSVFETCGQYIVRMP
jgi:anti-sigma B factor antagonist